MALQHLRSSTANKRPIPTVMSAGQLAINTHEGSPGLFFKDSNGDLVKVGPVHIGTTAPNSSPDSVAATALVTGTVYQILTVGNSDFTLVGASANTVGTVFTATGTTTGTGTVSGQQGNEKGEQWLDTTGSAFDLKIYDGTAWRSQSGEFVNVTGDTMTGAFGVVAGTASAPGVFFSGDTNTGLLSPGGDSVAVTTGGTQRVVVNASGNVGIGTTSPSEQLHLNGGRLKIDTTSGARAITLNAPTNGCYVTFETAGTPFADIGAEKGALGTGSADDFLINVRGSREFLVRTNSTERLRIDSSGRVLIGTTTEGHTSAQNLTVGNNTSGHSGITIRSSPSFIGSLYFSDATSSPAEYSGFMQYSHNGNFLSFGTNSTEKMRIDSSGNVGIGTSNPLLNLHINSATNANATIAYSENNILKWYTRHNASTDNFEIVDIPNTTTRLAIDSSGRLLVGATTEGAALADNLTVADSGHSGLTIRSGTASLGSLYFSDGTSGAAEYAGFVEYNHNGNYLGFGTGSTSRLRIDSSGRLLVNGTTATGDNKLQVISSDASINSLTIGRGKNSVTSNTALGDHALFTNTTGSANTGVGLNSLYYVTTGSNNTGVGNRSLQQNTGSNNTAVGASALFTNNVGSDNTAVGYYALLYNQSGNNNTAVGRYALVGNTTGSKNIGIGYTAGDAITTGSNNTIIGDIAGSATLSDTVIIGAGATERMRIDSSGNVGIGTSSPSQKLHIQDSSGPLLTFDDATTQFGSLGSYNRLVGSGAIDTFLVSSANSKPLVLRAPTGQTISFDIASSEAMRIDSVGRILIGPGATATPKCGYAGIDVPNYDYSIVMGGSDGFGNRANNAIKDGRFCGAHYTNAEEPVGIVRCSVGSSASEIAIGGGSSLVNAATLLAFYTASNNTTTGGSERMRIDSSGNVGIGVTSPNVDLEVNNTFRVSRDGSQGTYLELFGGSSSADPYLNVPSGFGIPFRINGSEKMRLDSSGNVFIGGTTAASADIALNANGSATFAGGDVVINEPGNAGGKVNIDSTSDGGNSAWGLSVKNNDSRAGRPALRLQNAGNGNAVEIKNSGNTATTVTITTPGAATFAGNIVTGNDPGVGGRPAGIRAGSNGTLQISKADGGQGVVIYKTGTDLAQIELKTDGSANFDFSSNFQKGFRIFDNGGHTMCEIDGTGANSSAFAVYDGLGSSYKVKIKHNGSIETAGPISSERASASNSCFEGFQNGITGTTSKIMADGSAEFARNIIVGDGNDITASTAGGVFIGHTGYVTAVRPASSSNTVFNAYQGATQKVNINAAGTASFAGSVTANGTVLTSDQRFKENITPAKPQLADIKALGAQLKNFDWNADAPSSNGTRFLGLIAQEAEAICPGIVKTIARTKQGAELTPEVVVPAVYETRTVPAVLNEEGEVIAAETTEQVLVTEEKVTPATYEELDDSYKGISHDALIMKLLGAVAELSAEVEALKAG